MADLLQQEEGAMSDPFHGHLRVPSMGQLLPPCLLTQSTDIYYMPHHSRCWRQKKFPTLMELTLWEMGFCFPEIFGAGAHWVPGAGLGPGDTKMTSLYSLPMPA